MRLVIATPLYPPEAGGPATYAALLERVLPERGIEVSIVKFSEVRAYPKLIRHFLYYRRVLRALKQADAVLALDPVSVGLPARNAARRLGKPLYVKIVGDYAWEQGRQRFGVADTLDEFVRTKPRSSFVRMLQKIQTGVARSAQKVIVPSAYLKGVVAAWGVPEERIDVIHNAVTVDEIGRVPDAVAALHDPYVVTVARLVPWKGVEKLIDAVKIARASTPVSLVIVGDGPDRSALMAHAKEVLGDGYVFAGALSRSDTLAVMQGAKLFALNTAYEGFSHVLLEAALLGVPVLTTASGGNREVLGENGARFTPVDDADAMAAELQAIIVDDAGAKAMALRTQARARKEFGLDTLIGRLIETLTTA